METLQFPFGRSSDIVIPSGWNVKRIVSSASSPVIVIWILSVVVLIRTISVAVSSPITVIV